jgi:hypothetical protein
MILKYAKNVFAGIVPISKPAGIFISILRIQKNSAGFSQNKAR